MQKPEEKKPEETGSKFDKVIVPPAIEKESGPINAADWIAQQKKLEEVETPDEKAKKKPAAADKKPAPREHPAPSKAKEK